MQKSELGFIAFAMTSLSQSGAQPKNPYTQLLSDALISRGLKLVNDNSLAQVWHLHWLHNWVYGRHDTTEPYRIHWKGMLKLYGILLFRKLRGQSTVWTIHNFSSHDRIFPKLERFFYNQISLLIDGFIVHSNFAKQALPKYLGNATTERIFVIPHGSYTETYPNDISPSIARKRLKIAEDDFVFLALGMIREYKGLRELVAAFSKLKCNYARLVIAGEVNGSEDLLLHLNEAAALDTRILLFPRFVPLEEIQIFMRSADIAVFPYRDITTSGSIPLAQTFALPCLASDLPPIRETIENCGGFLYNNNIDGELLQSMQTVIEQKETLKSRGLRHKEAIDACSWSIVAEKTFAVYRATIKK